MWVAQWVTLYGLAGDLRRHRLCDDPVRGGDGGRGDGAGEWGSELRHREVCEAYQAGVWKGTVHNHLICLVHESVLDQWFLLSVCVCAEYTMSKSSSFCIFLGILPVPVD